MKINKKWLSVLVALTMVATAFTPVFAQSETEPTEEPAVVEQTNSFVDNPIVKLLASFFNSLFTAPVAEEPTSGSGEGGEGGDTLPPDPTEEPGTEGGEGEEPVEEPTPVPTQSPEEQVAALHTDEDLGFGEITKLLAIAEEAQAECEASGTNCDVTVDSLLAEYNSGTGMGELFAKYDKPEITGVGQVRNGDKEKSNNGKAKGKNK
jgi:hypothetical protein